jgi:hypothetical protein
VKTPNSISLSIATLTAAFSLSSNAVAIPLPDTGTCNSHPCLKISSTLLNGTALYGRNDSTTGNGVYGGCDAGVGVLGAAASGTGGHFTSNSSGTALVADNPGGTAVYVSGNGVYTGSWTQSSDARLKKDIKDLPHGLDQLLQLRPVTYKLKEGDDRTRLGLIAQEVQKIIPEAVLTDGKGMLGVDYIGLLPVVINTVQEQQRIIHRQEARINALERGSSGMKLSSILEGGALVGLLPLGLVLASRRRKGQAPAHE